MSANGLAAYRTPKTLSSCWLRRTNFKTEKLTTRACVCGKWEEGIRWQALATDVSGVTMLSQAQSNDISRTQKFKYQIYSNVLCAACVHFISLSLSLYRSSHHLWHHYLHPFPFWSAMPEKYPLALPQSHFSVAWTSSVVIDIYRSKCKVDSGKKLFVSSSLCSTTIFAGPMNRHILLLFCQSIRRIDDREKNSISCCWPEKEMKTIAEMDCQNVNRRRVRTRVYLLLFLLTRRVFHKS